MVIIEVDLMGHLQVVDRGLGHLVLQLVCNKPLHWPIAFSKLDVLIVTVLVEVDASVGNGKLCLN